MRRLNVGIFNPYLDTFGGGEKDVCVMASALARRYNTEIISITDVPKPELESRLNVDLKDVGIRVFPYFPNICYSTIGTRYISNMLYYRQLSSRYDLFINLVNCFPYPCFARRGVLRIQFPFDARPNHRGLGSYDLCVANSEYTRRWTKLRWGTDAEVIHPPVDGFAPGKKGKVVLSVGRFFAGGHNKKHIPMIAAFKRLCDEGLRGWEYHLIGSVNRGEEHEAYVGKVKDAAKGYPVYLHFDAPFATLKEYYAKASIFMHAAGFGEDEDTFPERSEHFGITTVEAMTAGCVPLVYRAGGQLDIVSNGVNGYLWESLDELAGYIREVAGDKTLRGRLSSVAIEDSGAYGRERYCREMLDMADRVTAGL